MQIAEIQAKCREIAGKTNAKCRMTNEQELRERFIEHVAEKGGPVLSFKAQMVLSTRNATQRRKTK